jgi:hypothetical protein
VSSVQSLIHTTSALLIPALTNFPALFLQSDDFVQDIDSEEDARRKMRRLSRDVSCEPSSSSGDVVNATRRLKFLRQCTVLNDSGGFSQVKEFLCDLTLQVPLPPEPSELSRAEPTTIEFATSPDAAPECVQLEGSFTLTPGAYGTTSTVMSLNIPVRKNRGTRRNLMNLKRTNTPQFAVRMLSGNLVAPLLSPKTTNTASAIKSIKEAEAIADDLLSVVTMLHAREAQYEKIDALSLELFCSHTIYHTPPPTEQENHFLDACCGFAIQPAWIRMKNTILDPVTYFQTDNASLSRWGKSEAVVDAPAALVLAWLWALTNYERMGEHKRKNGSLMRTTIPIPNSHSQMAVAVQKLPGALENRVFPIWWCWRLEPDGTFSLAFDNFQLYGVGPVTTAVEDLIASDSAASKSTRATTRGIWRIKPLADNVCEVSLVQTAAFNGSIPSWLGKMFVKGALSGARRLQNKYRRNGIVVDAEMRRHFSLPPRVSELTAEQRRVFDEARVLQQEVNEEGAISWDPLPCSSPFVDMYSRFTRREFGDRPVSLGKAVALLDCTPKEALSYWFDFGGRERMKLSMEDGNPARLVCQKRSPHDHVMACVVKMPFFCHDRDHVNRTICASSEDGQELFCASIPVDDIMDYGARFNTVRGVTTAFASFVPVEGPDGIEQCQVTLHQHLSANGWIPTAIVDSKIPVALSFVTHVRDTFARDDEIDEAGRRVYARRMRDEPPTYSKSESSLLDRVISRIGNLKDFKKLKSPDPLVGMYYKHITGQSVGVIRASTVVDVPVEECVAYLLSSMSREAMRLHAASDGGERSLTRVNDHHDILRTVNDYGIPGFIPREFVVANLWRRAGGDDMVSISVSTEDANFPREDKYIRATASAVFTYEKLPPEGSVAQTRLTWTCQADMGGRVPSSVVNFAATGTLMYLSTIRERFDRTVEINNEKIARFAGVIRGHRSESYEEKEKNLIDGGLAYFDAFAGMKSKVVKATSPSTTAKVSTDQGAFEWGWAETMVRATPEQTLSYLWDMKRKSRHGLERSVDEETNEHSQLIYQKMTSSGTKNGLIGNRELLTRMLWKRLGEGRLCLVTSPEESEKRPDMSKAGRSRRVVRATWTSAVDINRVGPREDNRTRLQYVLLPIAGGTLSRLFSRKVMKFSLSWITKAQEYFQTVRGVDVWDAHDGAAVGEVLVIKTEEERFFHRRKGESKVDARMRGLFKKYRGLKEIDAKYHFFQTMMSRVVQNKLRPGTADVPSKLCELYTAYEGNAIGSGLAMCLATNLTSEAGVDEWIMKFPALKELDHDEEWFRPMVNVVAQRLLEEVPWGMKMRVFTGAGLSMMDMISDINVILLYSTSPETQSYAVSLALMVGGCVLFQLLVAWLQHGKRPRDFAVEALVVCTGLKPAFDAARVAGGAKKQSHHLFDPQTDLVWTKSIEMAVESIPGCILQMYVYLKSEQKSKLAVASIVCSAFTTGFAGACLSYDYDVDPRKRRATPWFYGYMPDGGMRTVVFGLMVINAAMMLLIKGIGAAMLMLISHNYYAYYLACDMGFYLLQKKARGDMPYWLPLEGPAEIVMSFLMRVGVKTICDFACVIQHRHPGELGGAYWVFNLFAGLGTSFAAAFWYFSDTYGPAPEDRVVDKDVVMNSLAILGGVWLTSFLLFLLCIRKKYLWTFFSFLTSAKLTRQVFTGGKNDELKSEIFGYNKKQWKPIRSQVKLWVLENWEMWIVEEPDWFTPGWKGSVDDDMLPKAELKRQVADGGGKRRRSSVADIVGGGIGEASGRRGSSAAAAARGVVSRRSKRRKSSVHCEPPIVETGGGEKEEKERNFALTIVG